MVPNLGVFGEDCEAMVVISVEDTMDGMNSGERLWNEEEGGAFRFKSSPLAPNTQEVNVYSECNASLVHEVHSLLDFHVKGQHQMMTCGAGRSPLSRPAWGCHGSSTAISRTLLIPF